MLYLEYKKSWRLKYKKYYEIFKSSFKKAVKKELYSLNFFKNCMTSWYRKCTYLVYFNGSRIKGARTVDDVYTRGTHIHVKLRVHVADAWRIPSCRHVQSLV